VACNVAEGMVTSLVGEGLDFEPVERGDGFHGLGIHGRLAAVCAALGWDGEGGEPTASSQAIGTLVGGIPNRVKTKGYQHPFRSCQYRLPTDIQCPH